MEAARALATAGGTAHLPPVAVAYTDYEQFNELVRDAVAPVQLWMGDIMASVHRDATLTAVVQHSPSIAIAHADTTIAAPLVTIARDEAGRATIFAAAGTVRGAEHLIFFVRDDPGSLTSASLLSALLATGSAPIRSSELETATLSNDVLMRMDRESVGAVSPGTGDNSFSDARWFWLTALALLVLESLLRSSRTLAAGASAT
jgi:hypothetical protein